MSSAVAEGMVAVWADRVLAVAVSLLGDKFLYIVAAVVFVAVLEAMAEQRAGGALRAGYRLRKALEEITVFSMLAIMGHGLDLYLGLADTFRRATAIVVLAEKTMAALKAASMLGYSKITDTLEDVYANLAHLFQNSDDSHK